jgi:hypothetical protein
MSSTPLIQLSKNAPRTSLASATPADIWPNPSLKLVRLLGLNVTVAAATVITVRFKTSNKIIAELDFAAAGFQNVKIPDGGVTGSTGQGVEFFQTSGGAVVVGATAYGREE